MDVVLRKVQEAIQQSFTKSGGGAKYFGSARRGEGVELAADLNSTDRERQKSAVKRIIANMTMGRDVSQLFVDVVKLGQTHNIELKKLVYLYILNTAKLQPEKALLAVNTFLQDTTHASPIVRALAVRTMMCIRVESVMEYTLEPLRRAVVDADPYVRKTAAIAIGKLFHNNMNLFFDQGFVEELVKLLTDPYPVVSGNAAAVLAEVNDYGTSKVELQPAWANKLLISLPESSEWEQVHILEILSRVRMPNADETETLIERVVPRLSHTNPSVVLAAIKVIATQVGYCDAEAVSQYTPRINSALLTLTKGDHETQYVVCKNIHALLVIFPSLFQGDLDAFYIRFSDPPYVKREKLRLLLKLVSPSTAVSIIKELGEYSTEVDVLFIKEVVNAIAMLAIKVDIVSSECATLLIQLVERHPEVLPEVITASKNIVRKYPDLLLLDPLINTYNAELVADEEAKVSLIWMLGEYCDFVENGQQLLATFIEDLLTHEQSVQLAILSAVIKMFLRDPQGMEGTLTVVLDTLTTRSEDPDLRDRAFAYWRLLSKGMGVAKMKEIVHGQKAPVKVDQSFSDAMTMTDIKQSINTAAALYGKPFHSFLPVYGLADDDIFDDDEDEEEADDGSMPAGPIPFTSPTDPSPQAASQTSPAPAAAPIPPPPQQHVDVFDDLFGGGPSPSSPPLPSSSEASPTQTNRTAAGSPKTGDFLDDLFGGGGAAQSAAAATQQAPRQPLVSASAAASLPLVASPAQTGGVEVRAQLIPGPFLDISIANHTNAPIRSLVLQLNTNCLAYVPSQGIDTVISGVQPGGTERGKLQLRIADSHFSRERCYVECGLKGDTCQLIRFVVNPDLSAFVQPSPDVSQNNFAIQWNAVGEQNEAKILLEPLTTGALLRSNMPALFSSKGFAVVNERVTSGVHSCFLAGVTTLGLTVLCELALNQQNASLSFMRVRSPRVADVVPIVRHVVEESAKSLMSSSSSFSPPQQQQQHQQQQQQHYQQQPSPAPQQRPPQNTATSIDDLFS